MSVCLTKFKIISARIFFIMSSLLVMNGCSSVGSGEFPKLTSQQAQAKSNYGYVLFKFNEKSLNENEELSFKVFYDNQGTLFRKFILATISPEKQLDSFKVFIPKYNGFVTTTIWLMHKNTVHDSIDWSKIADINLSTLQDPMRQCHYENGHGIVVRIYSADGKKAVLTPFLSPEINCVEDSKPIRGGHY